MTERFSMHARSVYGTLALTLIACGPEAASIERQRSSSRAPFADDRTVTLITGDRVTLRDGAPIVAPGPGRTHIEFSILRDGDRVRVIPEDVAPMIGAGDVDLALFDVTLLLDGGYGDQRRDDLPLIITHVSDTPGFARSVPSGTIIDRALPALHAVAMRQPKANAGAALAALGSSARLAPGPRSRIWLDRVRKPLLDHSVPQIGGPAAHARGFTGAGVIVAVLDTGIDDSHPDLAGKVIAAEDFTGDGAGVMDVFGHGTHVASIIAGTGAASSGRFAGVAPDAQLLNGRVCDEFGGCLDSAILAGMSWAVVEQHAKIVNMSLGDIDRPEIDPVEDAVNQLSADFGALFVVAAGNDGTDNSIESPGSADAALSVGAVDRDDQLAVFSSRGPRLGDRAIKPEVTAPGVDIVAARATNLPPLGPPVGAFYVALSGTSMATPHTAGAAALLAQQHPDWTGAQLKAQLIATASPSAALTAFQQGAGRIDIDRGTRQDVSAEPAALSLGVASFPHDDDPVIVRTVTYHNGGSAPVVLALSASLSHAAIDAAPPGMIRVDPAILTVPAGGTSDVTVTVTTGGDLVDGLYSGALVASSGDVRVETPVGVEREPESFQLDLDFLDRQGAPARALVFIFPAGSVSPIQFIDGHASFRMPRGRYAIDASVSRSAFLSYPRLSLDADTAVVFDSRLGKPIAVDVGDPSVALSGTGWQYIDFVTQRSVLTFSFASTRPAAQLGPDAPPDELVGMAFATLSDDPFGPAKIVYNLAHSERGHLPTGWAATLTPDQLATVDARHAGQADAIYQKGAAPVLVDPVNGLRPVGVSPLNSYDGPFERTERFFGPGFIWEDSFVDNRAGSDPSFPTEVGSASAFRDYRAGRHVTEQWNQAPFAPAFPQILVRAGRELVPRSTASRTGDQLVLQPSMVADNASPARISDTIFDHQRIALFRNGALVAERIDVPAGEPFSVPPGDASYRYEQDLERPASVFTLSTRVTAAWTFRSHHVPDDRPRSLPLPTMRFRPPLDPHNQTAAPVIVLPIELDRPPDAATPPIVRARLDVSFDDGRRWSPVPVVVLGDRAIAIVVHRAGAQFVSLRSSAEDKLGNKIEQTILRAYGLAP